MKLFFSWCVPLQVRISETVLFSDFQSKTVPEHLLGKTWTLAANVCLNGKSANFTSNYSPQRLLFSQDQLNKSENDSYKLFLMHASRTNYMK